MSKEMKMEDGFVCELLELVEWLMLERKGEGKKDKGIGRKEEVLRVLKMKKRVRVEEIGEILGISGKNVSSQLSYLRKDGIKICTDSEGRKYIEE